MRTPAEVKAVLWDLGGVLLRTENLEPRRAWEARLGLSDWELAEAVFSDPVSRAASVGRATVEEIWQAVGARFGLDEEETARLRADFFRGDRLDGQLLHAIRALRRARRVGMITNAWPDIRRWLENEWRIAHLFDPLIISAEVGVAKPDPRIYQLALQALGLPAHQVLFIDDFAENIAGAQAVGMQTHHFKDPVALIGTLQELLDEPAAG